jgi:hypothetical protein
VILHLAPQTAATVRHADAGMSPHRYRLVIEGELGPRYASAFEGMTLRAHDGKTEIIGPIIDPSHLQGLLERIAGLGLTLHSVTPLEAENGEPDSQPHTQPAGVDDREPGTNRGLPQPGAGGSPS